MRKKIFLTLPVALMVGFSLLALNLGIRKNIVAAKVFSANVETKDSLKDGDLIFQINIHGQGKAIQLATNSLYTHVGVLMKHEGQWYVYEAVQPVSRTPLNAFIQTGDSGHYVIKRLHGADTFLNRDRLAMMKTYLIAQVGKNYDPYFNWSDTSLYCSELAWKCYRKLGVSLTGLKRLKSYDLTSPVVKKIMKERYGNAIPYNEKVVSPGDIFNSPDVYWVAGHQPKSIGGSK